MPYTVAKVVDLVEELEKQGAQVANNVASLALLSKEPEVLSLSAGLMKTMEEAVKARADLDALCAAGKLVKKKHNVALVEVRKERNDEVEAWKVTKPQSEASLAKMIEETSATGKNCDPSAVVLLHVIMNWFLPSAVLSRLAKCEKIWRPTLAQLRNIYVDGCRVTVAGNLAKWNDI